MELNLSLGKVPLELENFGRDCPVQFAKSMEKGGLQLLTWATNGSKNSDSKPQIKVGYLRGSGSVFVGNKLVGVSSGYNNAEANKTVSGKKPLELTIGYNAEYAHRRHEDESIIQKDGGPGWLRDHIEADRDDLWAFIAADFKKGMGM